MKKYQTPLKTKLLLRDLAIANEYGALPADRRVQLKMPTVVVDELDRLFPNVDRSQLLTSLALQAINEQLHFSDRPDLGDLSSTDQDSLDEMWNYLEARDGQ